MGLRHDQTDNDRGTTEHEESLLRLCLSVDGAARLHCFLAFNVPDAVQVIVLVRKLLGSDDQSRHSHGDDHKANELSSHEKHPST